MKRTAGFTLIELAIVVAIMGFLAVGFLKVFESLRGQTGRTDTELSLDKAEEALRRFLLTNGRLPCPAGFTLAANNPLYGREAAIGGTCDGGIVVPIPNFVAPTDFAGVLPIRTLGLSGDRATDGWERQISYQVSADAVVPNALAQPAWQANNLVYSDSADVGTPANAIRLPAVVVLMSHGPNGHAGATVDGGVLQQPPATALNELENVNLNWDFVQAGFSEDQATPFDDGIRTMSEEELVAPLVENGALVSRTTQARLQLERIEAALMAYLVGDASRPGGAGPPIDPDGAPTPAGCDCSLVAVPAAPFCFDTPSDPQCNVCAPLVADPPSPPLPLGTVATGCARTVLRGLPLPGNDLGPVVGGAGLVLAGTVPTIALNLPATDVVDPWGSFIRYEVSVNASTLPLVPNPPATTNDGIRASIPEAGFNVWSLGPNGIDETDPFDPNAPVIPPTTTNDGITVPFNCGFLAPSDDICIRRTTTELIGTLAQSRVYFDN